MHTKNSAQRKPTMLVKIFLTFLLAVSVLPFVPGAVSEAEAVEVQPGYGSLTANSDTATTIAFDGKLWKVIGFSDTDVIDSANIKTEGSTSTAATTATLFLAYGHYVGVSAFDVQGVSNAYKNSTIHGNIESKAPAAGTPEGDLIIKRELPGEGVFPDPDKIAGETVTDARYWPLSVAEANSVNLELRKFREPYWLRSPASAATDAATVYGPDGSVSARSGQKVSLGGIPLRPAFKLDLTSVLFTSSATEESGKSSVALGSTLVETETPTGTIKLTVKDDANLALASASVKSSIAREVRFEYTGATAGKTLSVIIQNNTTQEVTYYGKLATVDASGTGEATLTVPDGYDPDTQSIKVFVEELNNNNYTDFASTPRVLDLTGQPPAPTGLASTPASSATAQDGTITGTSTAMEYRLASSSTWIPVSGTSITGLEPGTYEVRAKASEVVKASDVATITVDARPNVVSVTPTGASVSLTTTDLVITFDTAMNASSGTVTVDGTSPTTPPSWLAGNMTVTYTLPALTYGASYTVAISDFEDASGITMTTYAGHSFTTEAAPIIDCWFEGSSIFTKGSKENLVFVADKDFTRFDHAEIDGKTLTSSDATVTSGSTKATVQATYLETLSVGSHTVELFFSDGSLASGTFQVKVVPSGGKDTLAKTGDTTPITVAIFGLLCALAAFGLYRAQRTRKVASAKHRH